VSELAYVTTHFDLPWSPHFVADFLRAKCDFTRKMAVLWFWAPFGRGGGLRGNVRCLSYAHWKAHSGLPISVNWSFFARCYNWGTASENRLKIGVLQWVGQYPPNFHVEGDVSTNHFCSVDRPWMPYTFAADGFHTKKLCSRLLQAKCNFWWKTAVLCFWALWGLSGHVRCSS